MNDYISIKVILDNCLNHPLLQDLTLERAVAYTVDFLRVVGCPNIFIEKTTDIEIDEYRGQLPCDFHQMIQVRMRGHESPCGYSHSGKVLRYTTNSFHMSEHHNEHLDLTYKILGRVIFTSIKEGTLEIAYNAIAVDEDGFPLIPDNSAVTRALELYIKKQCFTILFDLGKIQQGVLQNVQLEYAFYVGLALSELIKPSIDELESITNSLNTLIPRVNEHKKGFRSLGNKEIIRRH